MLVDQPTTEAWPLEDPYENLTIGLPPVCLNSGMTINSVMALVPGRYCGNLKFNANADVTMAPGTYYIDSGDFEANGGAKIRCLCPSATDGVTIVLTSSGSATDIGTVTINGGADIQLNAPSGATATYKGVLFYQDQNAPSGTARFNGGATMILNGAIYFRNQEIQYNGDQCARALVLTVPDEAGRRFPRGLTKVVLENGRGRSWRRARRYSIVMRSVQPRLGRPARRPTGRSRVVAATIC